MNKLYKKSELWFSLTWIICYVLGTSFTEELSRIVGVEKILTLPFLAVLCAIALIWMKRNELFQRYGLCKTHIEAKRFIYYIPLIVLASCNFWLGVSKNGSLGEFALYGATMLCVGFLEELIFRGFLFRATEKDGVRSAIVVSSVTFGIGHIVNLFNGSGAELLPNACQVISAVAIGFLFVVIAYRGKTIVPCILAHQFINISSFFANESALTDGVRIAQSLVICIIAAGYAVILLKTLPKKE